MLNVMGATDDQKMLAIRWAKEWCNYKGDVSEKWLQGLNRRLDGRRDKGEQKGEFEDEKKVLAMAVRILRLSGHRNRVMRSARIFHSVGLKIGPVDLGDEKECPCSVAVGLEGKLMPPNECPVIPLSGCTAEICRCHVSTTTKMAAKRNQV